MDGIELTLSTGDSHDLTSGQNLSRSVQQNNDKAPVEETDQPREQTSLPYTTKLILRTLQEGSSEAQSTRKRSRARRAAHKLRIAGQNVGNFMWTTVQSPVSMIHGQGEVSTIALLVRSALVAEAAR